MSSSDTIYTARLPLPELIEQGRDNAVECAVWRDGALAAPSSGTVSLYNSSNTAIVDGASVTVTGSIATYTVTAATVADQALEEGYRIEWALTMPDGVVHTFRNDAALVRARLYPVVTASDLYRRHPDLDPSNAASLVASGTTHQDALDEAWVEIQLRLIGKGNRPNLVMSPSSTRLLHLYLTLEMVFRDFSTTSGEGKWESLALSYQSKAEAAWHDLGFLYDEGDDGAVDDPQVRRTATPSIWLNGRF